MSDTQLSPSVHEAVIVRHFTRDPITRETIPDAYLTDLHDAVQAARVAGDKADRVVQATLRSELRTPAANHKKAREVSFAIIESALAKIDAARKSAQAEIAQIASVSAGPPKPKDTVDVLSQQELRKALAALDRDERHKAISEALAADDAVLLSAGLNGRPMLSGLTPTEHAMHLHQWRQKYHGAAVDRAERLNKAITDADRAGMLLNGFVDSLTDAQLIARAEKTEAEAAEALKEAAG